MFSTVRALCRPLMFYNNLFEHAQGCTCAFVYEESGKSLDDKAG